MNKYSSISVLMEAKAQAQHEANLLRGGLFTENPEKSIAEGYEVLEDDGMFRISSIEIERSCVKNRDVRYMTKPLFEAINGINIRSPRVAIINNFGYAEIN